MTHLLALLLTSGCAAPDADSADTAADTDSADTAPDRSLDDTPPCDALVDPWMATTAEEVMAAYAFAPPRDDADPLYDYSSGFAIFRMAILDGECPTLWDDSDDGGQFFTVDEEGCTSDRGYVWSGWGQMDGRVLPWWLEARALRLESGDYTIQLDGAYEYVQDDGGQSFRTNSTYYYTVPAEGIFFERTWIGHGEVERGGGWAKELYVRVAESSAGVTGDYCVTETRTEGTTDGSEWSDVVGASVARIVWTGAEGCGDVTIDGVAVGSACL